MKGYDSSPLERDKVIDFITRLEELQRRQKAEFEKHQVNLHVRRFNIS